MTASVRRLQPLRVLLSGRDRRFVRVTSFLLERRGYDVATSSIGDAVEAAERHRADVVLLESAATRAETGRTVAALQASNMRPELLIVSEDGASAGWSGASIVAKWTPIERLVERVEAAALDRVPPAVAARLAKRERQERQSL